MWTIQPHGAEHRLFAGHDGPVTALALDRTARIVTGGADGTVRTWQPDGTAAVTTWPEPVVALACSPTADVIAVALRDGSAHLNGADGDVRFGAEVESLAWSPDGSRLAAGCKEQLSTSLGRCARQFRRRPARTRRLGRSARLVPERPLPSPPAPTTEPSASGTSNTPATAPSTPATRTTSTRSAGHPTRARLATCSADWTIRIWDLTGTDQPRVLTGHDKRVRAVAWAPDGRRLASCSDDRTVRVWGSADDDQGEVIGVHRDGVTSLAWLPYGRQVVTGSADGTARVWADSVDLAELTAVARSRVFRALTDDERQAHLLTRRRQTHSVCSTSRVSSPTR